MREWSVYQRAIFDAIRDTRDNLRIQAVAGSGKTTTIVEALNYTSGRVLFLAFNKHIADELRKRAPRHVEVRTCHSFGFTALSRGLPVPPNMDDRKLFKLVRAHFGKYDEAEAPIRQLVSYAKGYLVHDEQGLLDLMTHHDVVPPKGDTPEYLVKIVLQILEQCAADRATIDYDDMIWMPIALGLPVRLYDMVMVDEAQDLNPSQMELLARAVGGRVVVVGDSRQSLYGFRGADTAAMDRLAGRFKTQDLPLSISYRCPKAVVEQARVLVPHIESAPDAPRGSVRRLPRGADLTGTLCTGHMVLCRTTAPLVELFFELLRVGTKATLRGRDLGKGLLRLIDRLGGRSLADFVQRLDVYQREETEALGREHKTVQAQALDDKASTLRVLAARASTLAEMRLRIEEMFSDDHRPGVLLSTVHRAKGLEAPRVWILRPDLIPHPMAKKAWEQQQERNIAYVAITRAQEELTYVGDPGWEEEGSEDE